MIKMLHIIIMHAYQKTYLYIIQFVCLFVRDLGKNYCTGCHQTLRDYEVQFRKCPPRVKIDRLTVHVQRTFDSRFFLHGWWPFLIIVSVTSGYWAIRLAVVQRSNCKLTVVIATNLCCHQRRCFKSGWTRLDCAQLAVAGEPAFGGLTC